MCTRLLSCPQRSATASKPGGDRRGIRHVDADAHGIGRTGRSQRLHRGVESSRPLAITATLAPSAAKVCAMARPMPLLPPVTTAVEPVEAQVHRVSF